jgi:hypothetical protein
MTRHFHFLIINVTWGMGAAVVAKSVERKAWVTPYIEERSLVGAAGAAAPLSG